MQIKRHVSRGCLGKYAFALIAVAGLLAYAIAFDGAFIEDSKWCVRDNPHIGHLWPPSEALSLPMWNSGETLDGRPILSLSFALNRRLLGNSAWGYRVVNLAIHIGAAMTLFALIRRLQNGASPFALVVALLWVVHPLQTQSVTYIAQRAESLAGLLLLLTVYRAVTGMQDSSRPSYGVAVTACLLGSGVKEIIAAAPLLVLLVDYTFISGSLRRAIKAHKALYAALALCWPLLLALAWLSAETKLTDWQSMSPLTYALTQAGVILHYLRLVFVPYPLVMDYGWPMATRVADWALPAAMILVLLAATVWGLCRRKWWGFAGAWFFVILAPTSSFLPLARNDLAAEHRMYLPLAAVLVIAAAAVHSLARRVLRNERRSVVETGLAMAAAAALIVLTVIRNRDYGDELQFWTRNLELRPRSIASLQFVSDALCERGDYEDAVTICRRALDLMPDSYSVHCDLGAALLHCGGLDEAILHLERARELNAQYPVTYENMGRALIKAGRTEEGITFLRKALELNPQCSSAHCDWGNALMALNRQEEAIDHYRRALEIDPRAYSAHNGWGSALAELGRYEEAIVHFRAAVALNPESLSGHCDWGNALMNLGRATEAIDHYRTALDIDPRSHLAHCDWADALVALRRYDESIAHYRAAIDLSPECFRAHSEWAHALARKGEWDAAVARYRRAIELRPDSPFVHYMLANTLVEAGRPEEAPPSYRRALELEPLHSDARNNLGTVLDRLGRADDAIACFEEAISLDPDDPVARYNYANVLRRLDRQEEARRQYREAIRLKPDYAQAHNNLGAALVEMGGFNEGMAHLAEGLRLQPSARGHFAVGRLCARRGKTDSALAHLRSAHAMALAGGDRALAAVIEEDALFRSAAYEEGE